MEPQVTAEHYKITLTDDNGPVVYYKERLEVGDFINGINWAHVRHFSVEPVEPLADWELELLGCVVEEATVKKASLSRDELQMLSAVEHEPVDFWKTIESLPIRSFEINRAGDVRHRASKRLMEQEFDIDQMAYRTILKINGVEFTIDSRRMADTMWKEEVDAS